MTRDYGRSIWILTLLFALALAGPAAANDISGTWDFVFSDTQGSYDRTIELSADGEKLSARHGDEEYTGTVKDDAFEFSGQHLAPEAGYAATLEVKGKLVEGKLEGTATWEYNELTFEAAKRDEEEKKTE